MHLAPRAWDKGLFLSYFTDKETEVCLSSLVYYSSLICHFSLGLLELLFY